MDGLFVSEDMDTDSWWKKAGRWLRSIGLLVHPSGSIQVLPLSPLAKALSTYKRRIQRIRMKPVWTIVTICDVIIIFIIIVCPEIIVEPGIFFHWLRGVL